MSWRPSLILRVLGDRVARQSSATVLHASTVVGRSGSVVLAGPTGSGKSTLTLAAVTRSWRYVSEEHTLLDTDARCVPFARPIQLKAGSHAQFMGLPHLCRTPGSCLSGGRALFEVASIPGSEIEREAVRPSLVVLPRFDPSARTTTRELPLWDALARIAAHVVSPRHDTGPVRALLRLVSATRVFSLDYASSSAALAAIERLDLQVEAATSPRHSLLDWPDSPFAPSVALVRVGDDWALFDVARCIVTQIDCDPRPVLEARGSRGSLVADQFLRQVAATGIQITRDTEPPG